MTFLPMLPSGNENSERELSPMSQPVYTYLSGLTFLADLTLRNKQSFQNSKFKSGDHVSNS